MSVPCGTLTSSDRLCLRLRSVRMSDLKALPASARSRRRSRLDPSLVLAYPLRKQPLKLRSGPAPGPKHLVTGKPAFEILKSTACPFAALLGTTLFRAALASSLSERPGLLRREKPSLPAPLAGDAPEILRNFVRSSIPRDPLAFILATFTPAPCRRRSGSCLPALPGELPAEPTGGQSRCPPIT
jgi:hypothetical protein